MIIYEANKKAFLEDVYYDRVEKKIKEKVKSSYSEISSWLITASYMERILRDEIFPDDISIAMEFTLHKSRSRVDFIVAGSNTQNVPILIIIEFKLWSKVSVLTDRDDMVRTENGNIVTHPLYQAYSYAKNMKNLYSAIEENKIILKYCACLPCYEKTADDAITNKHYKHLLDEAPIFLRGESDNLKQYIYENIKYGDDKQIIHIIENGGITPYKQLQDNILQIIRGKEIFTMMDYQKNVFERAISLARASKKDGKKRVYIVNGGPGTGKSVIAINLLAKLSKIHKISCQYITKNQCPRDIYSEPLVKVYNKKAVNMLFCGSGRYINTSKNEFNALIVDEAHRLTKYTGYTKKGKDQIKEIMNAARFSIYFIDPKQRVHMNDYATIEKIKEQAKKEGAEIYYDELEAQYRCGGAQEYIDWVEAALQYKGSNMKIVDKKFLKDYEVKIIDDPNELKRIIVDKNKLNNKSRIVAGYCWEWKSKNNPNGNVYDIIIPEYNFKMKWNFKNTIWASNRNSVNQVGCIHTSQGIDFDYIGVIIGKDIRYEKGKIVVDYKERAKEDRQYGSFKGIVKLKNENPSKALKIEEEIIKNTYRTLLTRAQKGCYIYCEDKALASYLKKTLTN